MTTEIKTTTEDVIRYDPAVDRKLIQERGALVLKLGHEGNTPLYALQGLALATAQDKGKTWKRRVSWTFGVLGHEKNRLVIKPAFRWDDEMNTWFEDVFGLILVRFTPGPVTIGNQAYPNGVLRRLTGHVPTWPYQITFNARPSPEAEADLLAVAEVLETLDRDAAAVFARAGAWGRCCFCNKPLTEAISLRVGYGPDCAQRLRLAHGSTYTKVPA